MLLRTKPTNMINIHVNHLQACVDDRGSATVKKNIPTTPIFSAESQVKLEPEPVIWCLAFEFVLIPDAPSGIVIYIYPTNGPNVGEIYYTLSI